MIVKTLGGYIASIQPQTAVAWFGKGKNAEGKFASAGCFHQGFLVDEDIFRKWVQQRPLETGEAITIEQSLRTRWCCRQHRFRRPARWANAAQNSHGKSQKHHP